VGGAITAAVVKEGFHLSIKNSIIANNSASRGGGLQNRGGMVGIGPNVTIANNTSLYGGEGDGGGLLLVGGCTYLRGNVSVYHNTAGTTGGGIYLSGGVQTLTGYQPNCSAPLMMQKDVNVTHNKAMLAGKWGRTRIG
jgi:hypothetical protein